MKIMSKLSLVVTFALTMLLVPFAQAQLNTNPPPVQDSGSFFSSALGYLTSFNPELEGVLATHKGTLWSGAEWQAGAHVSTSLGLEYRVWGNLGVESETRFADVSGGVLSQSLGVNYSVDVHDVRFTAFVHGAYEFVSDGVSVSDKTTAYLGLRAKKMMTTHTFSQISFTVPVERAGRPIFSIGVGILF